MSSYRGGAWDGGPPGAEADYPGAPSYAPAAPPRAMPTTDPWTGVSYSQYGAPPYDYQTYTPGYTYAYDSSYYQRPDGTYYGKYPESGTYHQQLTSGYEYPTQKRERTRSPVDSHRHERRRSYQTNSRSVSPYDKRDSPYSKKRDRSYEESHRRRSRSKSPKRKKYSSSDSSSSRSHSYSPQKRRKSVSSNSSSSNRSYKKKSSKTHSRDQSVPPRDRSNSGSREEFNVHRMSSVDRLSKSSHEAEKKSKDAKSHSKKDKKARKVTTPTKKQKKTKASHKKAKKSPVTASPKGHKKHKDRSNTLVKKKRDSSLTPPKMYRMRRSSSSKSRSRSPSPSPSPSPSRHSKRKRSRSRSPHQSISRSSSRSVLSTPPRRSRSKSRRKMKRKSRSKSRTKRRSASKTKSTSQRRSKSRGKGNRSVSKSSSRSRSNSSRSRSRSGSPTDEKRRGQFTVADRKRFWKQHRNRQEEKDKGKEPKTPPKELKPPPGAVESTTVDDIEYGDPPEVEGPNFAELLLPDQAMNATTSKSRAAPLPIKNDGSFLEMFKKMQEETKKVEPEKKPEIIKKPALPFIGKRRGGRVLKTGLVKKAKAIDEQTANNAPKDAWSLYMQEVKKYRETSCEEERKTRPLVK